MIANNHRFLATFRKRVFGFYWFNFLSRCFLLLLFTSFLTIGFSQNVITVKKEKTEEKTVISGFYYSDAFTLQSGSPNQPPQEFTRMYFYIDQYGAISIFHSAKPIKKVYALFSKKGLKMIEESGKIEIKDGEVFITTSTHYGNNSTYRYVGVTPSETPFFIEYKASYKIKKALNLYLYKYAG